MPTQVVELNSRIVSGAIDENARVTWEVEYTLQESGGGDVIKVWRDTLSVSLDDVPPAVLAFIRRQVRGG